ncbi:MAG: hypothetical protein IT204_06395 [Fimbriimonadaceae bacterium]|nr:hypothetical protein [Fimbriimonadaceae bacterium]
MSSAPPGRGLRQRLFGNSGWSFFGSAMTILSGLLVLKLVDPATFGLLSSIAAAQGVVSQWIGFRTWEACIKYLSRFLAAGDAVRTALLLRVAYLLDGLAGGLTCLVLVLLSPWAARTFLHDQIASGWIALYATISLAQIPVATAQATLRAANQFRSASLIDCAVAAVRLLLVGSLHWLPEPQRLGGLIGVQLLCASLQGAVYWLVARRARGPLPRLGWRRADWQPLASERRGLLATLCSSNATAWLKPLGRGVDALLVVRWFGPEVAGLFQASRKLGDLLCTIGGAGYSALQPELAKLISRGDSRRAQHLAGRSGLLLAAVMALAGLLVAALLQPLLSALRPLYLPAVVPACWMLAAMPWIGFTMPFQTLLTNSRRPWLATVCMGWVGLTQLTVLAIGTAGLGGQSATAIAVRVSQCCLIAAVLPALGYFLASLWMRHETGAIAPLQEPAGAGLDGRQ